jgi:hypothetical protein
MNSTRKIFNLCLFSLFILLFIPPLCAEEPLTDDEELPLGGEEATLSGEISFGEEFIQGENLIRNENFIHGEETIVSDDEPLPNDELAFDDDFFFDDDSFVFDAPTLVFEVPIFETRSFDEVFPGLPQIQKSRIIGSTGIRHSFEKNDFPMMTPATDSGIDLFSRVMLKKPSHIIEAIVVVPYNKRELDMLDIYNALRNIKDIQDHTITLRGNAYKVFKDTTRIESAQNRRPVSDPPPADMLPFSETMYLRFVDQSMGDLYLRGDISISLFGITYSLTNFRDISYSIFRIMRAESFTAIIYLEPVKEGILVYSMSGIYIPGFVANRINLTPSMNYRITVLINWITDGLRREENNQNRHFYQLQTE